MRRGKVWLFRAMMAAIPCATALSLGAYLFGVKHAQYPIAHALMRSSWMRAHVFSRSPFEPLITGIVSEDDGLGGTNTFETVWDSSSTVRLSRRLFVPVEMFGEIHYAYRPGLHKLSFVTGFGAGYQKLETVDGPALRDALSRLGPLRISAASYDQAGHRLVAADASAPCERRALFLGDSFTDGLWVEDSETFASQYGRLVLERTGVRVCAVNAGVNGYGTLEEAYVLEDEWRRRPADLVVLAHFPNDVAEDYGALLQDRLPDAGSKWEVNLGFIQRMARFCREHRATFVIMPIPPAQQLVRPETRRSYQDVLERVAAAEGAIFVDVLPQMDRYGAVDELYWPWDPHLTQRGHFAIADVLAQAASAEPR